MKRCLALMLVAVMILTTFTAFAKGGEATSIKIGLSKTTMKVGEIQKMIISVTPTDASPVLEYESDNSDVVTATIGTLIANSEGTANITVRVSGTEISDTVQVVVSNKEVTEDKTTDDGKDEEKPSEEIVKVKKITVENKTLYLDRYETERIAYSLSPNNVTNDNITFQSSNTSVATVDDEGNVYAKRKGNTIITLESEDGNASATVKVYVTDYDDDDDYDSTLRNIYITYDDETVTNEFEVMESATVQFSIKTSPSSAGGKVKWRSSNTRIATVDSNGRVTGAKKGTCTIYATSTVNSSKKDSIKVVVTDYVKYPEQIIVTPQENAVFETGNAVQFISEIYPDDATERDIVWKVVGGADISQKGLLQITDAGEITVKAYSTDCKVIGEYKFNATYSQEHFLLIGSAYNLNSSREIEMFFDAEVGVRSAMVNIFATAEEYGNGERLSISVKTNGKKITVAPTDTWPEGDVFIFVKGELCDVNGNELGKNLKYKLNIRGNVYDKQN